MEFREIKIEDKELFDRYFKDYPQNISELTFTNLFCWRESKKHEFAIFEGHLLITFKKRGKRVFYLPIGENPSRIIDSILSNDKTAVFGRVEKDVAMSLKDRYNIIEQKDMHDYVYDVKELVELKGTKFMEKRNFIKQMMKRDPQVCRLKRETVKEFMNLSVEWCNIRECHIGSDIHNEFVAIKELLENFEVLGVTGTCVHVEGKIAGFAIGERLNDSTFVEHFEKGDSNFKGIYQFTLHEFCKIIPEGCTFLNREQDLCIEGLRKAKNSYNPVNMTHKYKITSK
jgi:hypothetical protein